MFMLEWFVCLLSDMPFFLSFHQIYTNHLNMLDAIKRPNNIGKQIQKREKEIQKANIQKSNGILNSQDFACIY